MRIFVRQHPEVLPLLLLGFIMMVQSGFRLAITRVAFEERGDFHPRVEFIRHR